MIHNILIKGTVVIHRVYFELDLVFYDAVFHCNFILKYPRELPFRNNYSEQAAKYYSDVSNECSWQLSMTSAIILMARPEKVSRIRLTPIKIIMHVVQTVTLEIQIINRLHK